MSKLDFFKKYKVTKADGSTSVESRFDMGAMYFLGMILIAAVLLTMAVSVFLPLIILLWYFFYGYKFASGTKMSVNYRYFVLLSAIAYVITAGLYFYSEIPQSNNFVKHFFDKDLYTLVIPSVITSLIIVLIPLYKIKIVKIFTLIFLTIVFIYIGYSYRWNIYYTFF